MRLLFATHDFGLDRIGGTEVLTLNLVRGLRDLGHDVAVVCADNHADVAPGRIETSDERCDGTPVHRLRFDWRKASDPFAWLYDNPAVPPVIERYVERHRPDIAHVTSCYTLTASVIGALARHVPTVMTATDFWFVCARNTLLHSSGELCAGPESAAKCARCLLADSGWFRLSDAFLPAAATSRLLSATQRRPWLTRLRGLRGMHGNWDDRFQRLRQALGELTFTVTASRLVMDNLIAYGLSPERIAHSPYGIDLSWTHGLAAKTPSSTLRLGFIGALIPAKGPDLLIRAVRSLPRDVRVSVTVLGDLKKDEVFGARLQALAGDDPRIRFAGTFEADQLGRVFQDIDALVVPSIWYDFPLVIPSALATKTPLITTDLPGMNELVRHEQNGLLFPKGDWQALAALIARLVEEPGLLDRLVRGIEPVKDTAAMAREYERLYERVLGRSPATASPA